MSENAIVVGAGSGLSAALARCFAAAGMRVVLAARDPARLEALASEIDGRALRCDASSTGEVEALFEATDREFGSPDLVVYNPSARVRGALVDIEPDAVRDAIAVTAFGGFLVARAAAARMLERGSGSIQFTGASASVKGFANSASFAMGKFALRGLAQSAARELAPQGIHVAHFVIDGSIAPAGGVPPGEDRLDPEAIAATYLQVHRQPRSAWTWEVELRPWVERF